ncbi:MAG: 3-dehydroquinate synthase [Rhodospirillales bacterium]|nr:3-dehydroquinate synthase [Rhodospirillales bacterium]
MSEQHTIAVDLGDRSYDIHIGQELLSDITAYIPLDLTGRSLFVLTDENVSNPHAMKVYSALKRALPESIQMLAVSAGEQSKSFETYQSVISWMLDHGVTRQSVLVAVGGGVVGDLAGFAAATVMRGIPFVQVPTTLLSQVDSSVGGKTGINVPQGKNLVGAFYQPVSVVCDLDTLTTLPRRELLAGYAEVVKYGLINDPEFFIWLEKESPKLLEGDRQALAKAIETSCRKKTEIVAQDERESGVRALLNLGHTFGHALEAAAGYDGRLLHGEAVAIGTVMAYNLSARLGLCPHEDARRVQDHFAAAGLPTRAGMIFPPLENIDAEGLAALMKHDKKATAQRINFILTRGVGRAFIAPVDDMNDVKEILNESLQGAA